MRVVKEPVEWKIEKECVANKNYDGGCGAVLEISLDDLYLDYEERSCYSQGDQDYYSYTHNLYFFKCPCCGKDTLIDNDEIPINIRMAAFNLERNQVSYKKYLRKVNRRK